jgi:DNA-binding transcriptional ArsR family regulator
MIYDKEKELRDYTDLLKHKRAQKARASLFLCKLSVQACRILITEGPLSVSDLVSKTGKTQPEVSKALIGLKALHLVNSYRKGKFRIYEFSPTGLELALMFG